LAQHQSGCRSTASGFASDVTAVRNTASVTMCLLVHCGRTSTTRHPEARGEGPPDPSAWLKRVLDLRGLLNRVPLFPRTRFSTLHFWKIFVALPSIRSSLSSPFAKNHPAGFQKAWSLFYSTPSKPLRAMKPWSRMRLGGRRPFRCDESEVDVMAAHAHGGLSSPF